MSTAINRRRFFAPEVIQSSAMDCGPASLKCLLEGYGIPLSYGRLREACQTGVDGTSIDTLEEIAVKLGIPAEQVMVPVDHVLLPEAKLLPALIVVRLPNGNTHFVVVWRRIGPFVQIMDPGVGRQWISVKRFEKEIYVHQMAVPAAAWHEYATSGDYTDILKAQMTRLGLGVEQANGYVGQAVADERWQSIARLDGAVRLVGSIIRASGRAGRQTAVTLLNHFTDADLGDDAIPADYLPVRQVESSEEDMDEEVVLRGAVLIKINRDALFATDRSAEELAELEPELKAALVEDPVRPLRELWQLMRLDGMLPIFILGLSLVLSAASLLFEIVLLRGLIDIGLLPLLPRQMVGGIITIATFLAVVSGVHMWAEREMWRFGRRSEVRLRQRLLAKIDQLPDRYFQSRLTSDMAERAHSIYRLQLAIPLLAEIVRTILSLALTAAGLVWLAPASWHLILIALGAAVSVPLLTNPILEEKDLRRRSHLGALSRFYFDGLLGLVTIRVHNAQRSMRREHESLLVEWGRTSFSFVRTVVTADVVQAVSGFGMAIWIVWHHLTGQGELQSALLLVYWVLSLPLLGEQLLILMRQYPALRSILLRIQELLDSPEQPPAVFASKPNSQKAVAIDLKQVAVLAAGNPILSQVNLSIKAGEHVAFIGPSGAGKSSLLGLLLGWYGADHGEVRVDGERLDRKQLEQLRQTTAWVDPAVQLWNSSLLDNLHFGSDTEGRPIPHVLESADLVDVLERLPNGMQSVLGEGGKLVSGGEGQRVRLGRALLPMQVNLALLDEPFRGLDRTTRRRLLARTRTLWQNATLLCVTHDVADTQTFDRVVVIEQGTIIEVGRPDELKAEADSHYNRYLKAQADADQLLDKDVNWRKLKLDGGHLTEVISGEAA